MCKKKKASSKVATSKSAPAKPAAKTRCNLQLELENEDITLDEFLLLGSNAKYFIIHKVKITENNGKTEVKFEKIIENLPNIREIVWTCIHPTLCITSNTVKELLKLQHFFNINSFELHHLPENFDAKTLFNYIKKQKNIKVVLEYYSKLTGKFKEEVDEIADEVIATEVFNYKPPLILYCDRERSMKMMKIFNCYCSTRF